MNLISLRRHSIHQFGSVGRYDPTTARPRIFVREGHFFRSPKTIYLFYSSHTFRAQKFTIFYHFFPHLPPTLCSVLLKSKTHTKNLHQVVWELKPPAPWIRHWTQLCSLKHSTMCISVFTVLCLVMLVTHELISCCITALLY
jgi:hypothetical protein